MTISVSRLRAKVSEYTRRLLLLRATPNQIATGFAVGVFIGVFPTFGLGALVIFALAPLWKFNVPAAVLGTLLGNPLLAPVWIVLGCLIVDISPAEIKVPHEDFSRVLGHYSSLGLRYLLGISGVSLAVAVLSYPILFWTARWFQGRRKAGSPTNTPMITREEAS